MSRQVGWACCAATAAALAACLPRARAGWPSSTLLGARLSRAEVLRRNYSYECDIWSCGVILYILLSGVPPFWGDTEEQIFSSILKVRGVVAAAEQAGP